MSEKEVGPGMPDKESQGQVQIQACNEGVVMHPRYPYTRPKLLARKSHRSIDRIMGLGLLGKACQLKLRTRHSQMRVALWRHATGGSHSGGMPQGGTS